MGEGPAAAPLCTQLFCARQLWARQLAAVNQNNALHLSQTKIHFFSQLFLLYIFFSLKIEMENQNVEYR